MYTSRSICSRCAARLRFNVASRRHASLAPDKAQTISASKPDSQPHQTSTDSVHTLYSDDSALALFQSVIKSPSGRSNTSLEASRATPPALTYHKPQSSLSELEIAAKLKTFTRKSQQQALADFDSFHKDVLPHLMSMHRGVPKHLYVATTSYLSRVVQALVHDSWDGKTGLQILQIHAWLGNWSTDLRNQLVMSSCYELIRRDNHAKSTDELFMDTLALWKHISQEKRPSQVGQPLAFVFPTKSEILQDIQKTEARTDDVAKQMHPLQKWMASLFPQYNVEAATQLVPGLLSTMTILLDGKFALKQSRQASTSPRLLIQDILKQKMVAPEQDFQIRDVFSSVKKTFPGEKLLALRGYVSAQWPRTAATITGSKTKRQRGDEQVPELSSANSSSALTGFHKQLRAAYRSRNPGAVMQIWSDMKARVAKTPALATQLREEESEFLDFWIFVWCAMRMPEMSQQTLDLMTQLGIQPSVKTYTAMMHGWRMCKDYRKTEALWTSLVQSNMKLDAHIWTERISGLIEAGKHQAGIETLANMMHTWKQAVAGGKEATAVRPNIEVVNATCGGLLARNPKAAREVLGWAASEGIEPNVRTYNILIQESFRNNAPEDVTAILLAMKNTGIEPDAATFTVMIEELVGRMEDVPAEEHVKAVDQIFRDMHAAGLKPNPETYGKMLYAVASLADGADEAVDAVQAHMKGNGFPLTPHMITILVERSVHRNPDNPQPIRDILQQHSLTSVDRKQGDQVLWERVMSAFAITGDTPSAMAVFDDLARAGRQVTSLSCLKDLLSALLDDGQRESAQRVVKTVLRHEMDTAGVDADKGSVHGGGDDFGGRRYWRHHFWHLARDNGLLQGEALPDALARGL